MGNLPLLTPCSNTVPNYCLHGSGQDLRYGAQEGRSALEIQPCKWTQTESTHMSTIYLMKAFHLESEAERGCARLWLSERIVGHLPPGSRRQEVPAMPHIDNDVKLDFKDVLLRPKRSTLKSRSEVDLTRSFAFRNSKQMYTGIPIIAANMDTVGTFEMAKVLCKFSLFTAVHKHYSLEQWKEFASQNPDCLEMKYVCLDVANGYSEHFVEFVKDVRKCFPEHTIMAGNVVTGEMVEELILSGADIIKVGIGPGSVCTTRKKTGVGYPQLSAVMECADAAHGLKGHIISDGGCSCPGDVAKAFGAGADFVMLGGMLAGHSESGGELV